MAGLATRPPAWAAGLPSPSTATEPSPGAAAEPGVMGSAEVGWDSSVKAGLVPARALRGAEVTGQGQEPSSCCAVMWRGTVRAPGDRGSPQGQ